MINREKIIKGLECCSAMSGYVCRQCPYSDDCIDVELAYGIPHLAADALELLKAQVPRVLTLEEVRQHNNQDGCVWFDQPTYNAVAAFVRKEEFEIEVISPYILGEPINHGYWSNSNYNVTWRCWTSRPTDEQREVIPWRK